MDDLLAVALAPALALIVLLAAPWLERREDPARTILWLGCLAWLIPHAVCVVWCFPSLDDWTYGAAGRTAWWATQTGYYAQWSGRIAATVVQSSWSLPADPSTAILVGYPLLLGGTLALLVLSLHAVVRACGGDRLITTALLAAFVAGMPARVEGLYWLSGTSTYTGGTACALLGIALLLRGRPLAAIAPCLLTPLFAETVLALMIPAVALIAWDRRRTAWMWLPVLAAATGATIELLAPGNGERMAHVRALGVAPPPWTAGSFATSLGEALAGGIVGQAWWSVAPLLAVAIGRGQTPAAVPGARLPGWAPPLLAVLAVAVVATPQVWTGMGTPRAAIPLWVALCFAVLAVAGRLGPRAWLGLPLVVASFIAAGPDVVVGAAAWAIVALVWWVRRTSVVGSVPVLASLVAVALLIGHPRWGTAVLDAAVRGPLYAAAQRQRIAVLAAAPHGSAVVVPLLPVRPATFHREDLHIAADTWQNRGCAAFYGLGSVRGSPSRDVSAPGR